MKNMSLCWYVLLSVGVILAVAPLTTGADQGGSQVTFVGQHYEGVISQVDTSAQSGTITTRFGGRTLAFRVGSGTRIWKTQRLSASRLQVGARVLVIGQTTKSDDLIQPYLIDMLPALPPDNTNHLGLSGKRKLAIFGTITAMNDDPIHGGMTVMDRSGKALTVALRGYRPLIGQTILGGFGDLTQGASIKIDGKMDAGAMSADRIVLQVALRAAKNGMREQPMMSSMEPESSQSVQSTASQATSEDDFSIYDLL